jgi:hypothetical protein
VLQVLREHKLYVNISKCIFYQNKIHYMGHIISTYGITLDPEKVEAIRGGLEPINVTWVRSYMVLYAYY